MAWAGERLGIPGDFRPFGQALGFAATKGFSKSMLDVQRRWAREAGTMPLAFLHPAQAYLKELLQFS